MPILTRIKVKFNACLLGQNGDLEMRHSSLRAALVIGACAMVCSAPVEAQKLSKQVQRLLAMTPADFQRTAALKDDSLDTMAQISTEPGFQEKRGLLKIVWNDNFLRAFIDKKTGSTTFQVYQYISYQGSWHFYQTANFETPAGPERREVTVINRSVNSCSAYGGCSFTEHVGFEVPESLLRSLASQNSSKPSAIWRFKIGSKSGGDWQDGMVVAEIMGMLAAVDQYRLVRGLSAVTTPTPEPTEETPPPVTTVTDARTGALAEKPKAPPAKKRPVLTCITCS